MTMTVNHRKCPHNHACPSIRVCPVGAISQANPHSLPVVDAGKCTMCGACRKYCPKRAFEAQDPAASG